MALTPLIKFETLNCHEILKLISRPGYDLEKLDSKPILANGVEFWRIIIKSQYAQAGGCIMIQKNDPDTIFIHLSLDLRRIWKVWKLFSDQKLVQKVRDILVENGGVIVEST